jgi:hypothetical protein
MSSVPPSVAPFASLLADLTTDLRRGVSCLLVCDKGWTLPVFGDLRKRLSAKNIRCEYLDGRPTPGSDSPADVGVMLTAITQIRKAVRGGVEGVVFVLPHLDVMTTTDGGWTNISREVVPLLYENPATQWLGFRDPSLPLLPVVEKIFGKCYVLDVPYRVVESIPVTPQTIPVPDPQPSPSLEPLPPPETPEPPPPKTTDTASAPEEASSEPTQPQVEAPPETPPTEASPEAPPCEEPPEPPATTSPDAPG